MITLTPGAWPSIRLTSGPKGLQAASRPKSGPGSTCDIVTRYHVL